MEFKSGIELNRNFYFEVIQPLIVEKFPKLKYTAAFIGYGSDVLGVDNATSMDHNWGPRCCIFLNKEDFHIKEELDTFFKYNLPFEFQGFPTNYTDPRYDFTQKMSLIDTYPINHIIEILEIEDYFKTHLSLEKLGNITGNSWLRFTDQVLLELTSGIVLYDGLGKLNSLREELKFYPTDILKIKLATLWLSIWNEEPFIGRCIELNDFIGLKLITSRIISSLIKISFYLNDNYIPYSKWLGTQFKNLSQYDILNPLITTTLKENDPDRIQNNLCKLYEAVISIHNENKNLPFLDNQVRDFFNRPYKVIFAESIVEKLVESIENEELKNVNLNKVCIDIKLESIDFTE